MSSMDLHGRCTCGGVRYRLTRRPMFVHCCHCSWCQRETGSAFAVNGMIEAECVVSEGGVEPETILTPSNSGKGQRIARCPRCKVAVWSHYASLGEAVCFVRVGTLEHPEACPPDIHIFTSTKQPWVVLPAGVPAYPAYYDRKTEWPAESLARRDAVLSRAGGN